MQLEKDRFQEETEGSLQQLNAHIQKLLAEKHELEEKLEDERR